MAQQVHACQVFIETYNSFLFEEAEVIRLTASELTYPYY